MISLPGEVLTTTGAAQAATVASSKIAEALRSAILLRGAASIALSGGNTPRGAYAQLARESGIEWAKVNVLWVDERSAPPTDDRSNYRWAKATLLDAVPAAASRAVRMEAERPDAQQAALEYEQALRARVPPDAKGVPAFDVMVLGVGDDGHTASLFPAEPTVDLQDRWVATVEARGGHEARLTLTVPVIQHARQVLVLAVGVQKRDALRRVSEERGDVHATPARIIRGCLGKVFWIVDADAVGVLAGASGSTPLA
jgi:6-phosphogluconolactonase